MSAVVVKAIDKSIIEKAKEDFIFGYVDEEKEHRVYPSIPDLATKYGVSNNSLYRASKADEWQKEKNECQAKIEETRKEQIVKNLIAEAEKLDSNSIKVSRGAIVAAGRVVQEALQNGIGNSPGQISPVDFSRVISAASNAQRIGKLALGEAQFISKVTTNVDVPEPLREIIDELDEVRKSRSERASHIIQ